MKLKDEYKKLRKSIIDYQNSKEVLDEHRVDDTGVYRLHYVEYGKKSNGVISTQYVGSIFKMGIPMERRDVLDVVSFLFNNAHKVYGVDKKSYSGTHLVDFMIENSKNFKFRPANVDERENVLDLYVVGGSNKIFKESRYYNTYFNWYNPSVTYDDVVQIYRKYGFELYDKSKTLVLD